MWIGLSSEEPRGTPKDFEQGTEPGRCIIFYKLFTRGEDGLFHSEMLTFPVMLCTLPEWPEHPETGD